jgi:hypothetical protein
MAGATYSNMPVNEPPMHEVMDMHLLHAGDCDAMLYVVLSARN